MSESSSAFICVHPWLLSSCLRDWTSAPSLGVLGGSSAFVLGLEPSRGASRSSPRTSPRSSARWSGCYLPSIPGRNLGRIAGCNLARNSGRNQTRYSARNRTRNSTRGSRSSGRSSGGSSRRSSQHRSSPGSSGRDLGSCADSYGGGIGGVGKATGASGLGLWKLGQGLAIGGACAILHIPASARAGKLSPQMRWWIEFAGANADAHGQTSAPPTRPLEHTPLCNLQTDAESP